MTGLSAAALEGILQAGNRDGGHSQAPHSLLYNYPW